MRRNEQRKRRSKVLAMAVAMALVLVACGNGDTDDDAAPDEPDAEEEQAPEDQPDTDTDPEEEPDAGSDDEWEELVAAAQEEGQVVMYSAAGEEQMELMAELFEERYGIELLFERLFTDPLMERVTQELDADNVQVDVVQLADQDSLRLLDDQGALAELFGPGHDAVPDEVKHDGNTMVDANYTGWALIYNTELVDEADAPTEWEDLLDPAYEGSLVLMSPETGLATGTWYYTMLEEYGDEFMVALGEQSPAIQQSGAAGGPMVAGGEVAAGAPLVAFFAEVLLADGSPLGVEYPDPTPVFARTNAVLADAPNPNAAMLFHNWTLTEEGQRAINDGVGTSPIFDLADHIVLPDHAVMVDTSDVQPVYDHIMDLWFQNMQ